MLIFFVKVLDCECPLVFTKCNCSFKLQGYCIVAPMFSNTGAVLSPPDK